MAELTKAFLKRVYLRDRVVLIALIVAFGIQIVNWILLLSRGLAFWGAPSVPLHYTIYFGIDLVGPGYGIFFGPAFGLLILILNGVVISITYEWHRLLAYVFSVGTVFIELLLLVASIFILLLNL